MKHETIEWRKGSGTGTEGKGRRGEEKGETKGQREREREKDR